MIDPDARKVHHASTEVDAVFYPRPGSTDDIVIDEVWQHDTYRMNEQLASRDGDLVIDLGANIGSFTILAAKLGAQVIAVEPNPESMEQLKFHVEQNELEREPELMEVAVGTGGSSICAVPIEDGAGSASIRYIPGEGADAVPVFSIDEILGTMKTDLPGSGVQLLKMDVEGGEYDVIAGASDGALRCIRNIALEYHGPIQLRSRDPQPGRFGAMVERLAGFFSMEWVGRPGIGGMLYGRSYTTR